MRLDDLRYFFHVATTGSFARAASLSYVSAPAISKAVRRLEDELDAELFSRTTRRVELTTKGEILLAGCRTILDEVDAVTAEIEGAGDEVRGDVRIGAMEVFSIRLLPNAISSLVRDHPDVRPLTHELVPQRIEALLLQHRIDVGFTIGGGAVPGLEYRSLGSSQGVLVCGRTHPLFRRGRVSAAQLRRHPSVVPKFLGLEHAPSLDQFPDDRWPRRVGATIELLQMAVQLVVDGTYLGYFPEVSVRGHLEKKRLKALRGLPSRPEFALHAVTRSGPQKPAVEELVERVRLAIGDLR